LIPLFAFAKSWKNDDDDDVDKIYILLFELHGKLGMKPCISLYLHDDVSWYANMEIIVQVENKV
jgi:hypothetical protein